MFEPTYTFIETKKEQKERFVPHDMCDSKYVDNNMDELDKINSFLLENKYDHSDVSTICKIRSI